MSEKELTQRLENLAKKLKGKEVSDWDFKQYVLGIIFYRYISESFANSINENEWAANKSDFNYASCTDEEVESWEKDRINAKGYFIKPSELFENIHKQALVDNENLNEKLTKVFENIKESTRGTDNKNNFAELFSDIDLNHKILGEKLIEKNKKIKDLLHEISQIPLSLRENEKNSFANAYGILLNMYAKKAGKTGGKSYTPPKVSELLTYLSINDRQKINKVYDPACGSGSLLLKFKKILGNNKVNKYYGQEVDLTTSNFCRMNMFLNNVNYNDFNIAKEDTLFNPDEDHKWIATNEDGFDAIVCNPPFNGDWNEENDKKLLNDERFEPFGVLPPKERPNLAFVIHALYCLSENGTATILCFPGALTNLGSEKKIRKHLIENNYVECLIGLPKNLFYGVINEACILILKKNKKDANVFFIDAKEEFVKFGTKNTLTDENIQNILQAYKEKIDKPEFCKLVSKEEIIQNDYKLLVSDYVLKKRQEGKIDIEQIEAKLDSTVEKANHLRNEINRIVKEIKNNMDKN